MCVFLCRLSTLHFVFLVNILRFLDADNVTTSVLCAIHKTILSFSGNESFKVSKCVNVDFDRTTQVVFSNKITLVYECLVWKSYNVQNKRHFQLSIILVKLHLSE